MISFWWILVKNEQKKLKIKEMVDKNLSMSECISEETRKNFVYFHGKSVRSKKLLKRMSKKPSLTRAILINTAIIVAFILTIWIFVIFNG